MARHSQEVLSLKDGWSGFDLMRVGSQMPVVYHRGDLLIVSGCITTINPMKNQAGWDQTVGWVDQRAAPERDVPFISPTSMSRYEGIYQCGTSMSLKPSGSLTIHFNKNTNPMVLHLSGLCCSTSREEPVPIPIASYERKDWFSQSTRGGPGMAEETVRGLEANELAPPSIRRSGNVVCLQGELKDATFGPTAQYVCTLPEGLRPMRELRWLANLLREPIRDGDCFVEHSVAVTLHTNGKVSVQGGKVHMLDQKGVMRVYQQKKKGRLCLEGIRFSLSAGVPIQPCKHMPNTAAADGEGVKAKLGYLVSDGSTRDCTAVCIQHGDVIMLEGYLTWGNIRPPNAKQPIATLPEGCWPRRREVFFTRGGSDLEERRRVDVDQFGRMFCPEGVSDGRVELTGIVFVAAEGASTLKPRDADWDDLKLQYHVKDVNVISTSFDGHELLEQFVSRCNYHEWNLMEYDFTRHAGRKMLLPLSQVRLRGPDRVMDKPEQKMNLPERAQKVWSKYHKELNNQFGVTAFHTLLHVSDFMLKHIVAAVPISDEDRRYLEDYRSRERLRWSATRQPGLTFSYLQGLAKDIVDQMFEHWDFKAQLQGALQNDFRPPATIEHLFPQRRSSQDWFIKKHIKHDEMAKFEEVRQFFYLYETTGSNMTHCSLMGASDVFTTTGKWHFPDAPEVQRQLFENIEWLFPKKVYLYMSERQTTRFPFIEDLDIQARPDWQKLPDGARSEPPDFLIMNKPERLSPGRHGKVTGDPGELMKMRAHAVHMIYPQFDKLRVRVYSASGYNKGKDMLKSSFHLVWPQLIVDPDRAPVIRHVTLGLFQKETMKTGSTLNRLQQQLLELDKSNNWELVFDSTTINARNGLRLPFNDKASMVVDNPDDKRKIKEGTLSKTKAPKKRVREDRPSKAVGEIEFEFDKDPETGEPRLLAARWVADAETHSIADWISMGTCRRDPNSAELTPWQLGQEVLNMLPKRQGEEFTFKEGEDDGEGGHWVTHKPFPCIRRCELSVHEFKRSFNEALSDEQDALKEEQSIEFVRVVGTWISVTPTQAIWQATASGQCDAKAPEHIWGNRRMLRPAEVVYLRRKGKVVIEGPKDVTEALIKVLKTFTKPDDNAIMPIYDVAKIS